MKNHTEKFATFLCAALVLCACSDDDYSGSAPVTMALIRQVESPVEESTEGIEEGDTAPGSKKGIAGPHDQAYYIMNNTSRTKRYRERLQTARRSEIKAFRENIVKAGIPISTPGRR